MRELAARPAVEVVRPRRPHRPVQVPSTKIVPFAETRPSAVEATEIIAAPPVATQFPSGSSRTLYPADASGAVGKEHVVGAYNSGVVVQRRDGTPVVSLSLPQFWARPTVTDGAFYDPRVAYDALQDRWVLMSLGGFNTVMLGVSVTGDPAGAWLRYSLNTDQEVDFTRLALTRDTVLLAANYGGDFLQTLVLSTKKAELYSGTGQVALTRYVLNDQYITPVTTDEAAEYVVTLGERTVYARKLTDNRYTSLRTNVPWGWFGIYAPQRGTAATMDTGLVEPASPVLANGFLHGVQTIFDEDNGHSAILWWKFRPDGSAGEWGTIDDPAGKELYAFPSLAVNRDGAMLIGFAAFSAETYPSAAYVYRDPRGNSSAVTPFRTGTSAWTLQRWGDYTATVVDPLDGTDFWTVQLVGQDATWQTWWGRIDVPATRGKRRAVGR